MQLHKRSLVNAQHCVGTAQACERCQRGLRTQVEAGAHYIKSDAVLKIAEGLQTPFPFLALLGFPVPPFLRDAAYDAVANNRYR